MVDAVDIVSKNRKQLSKIEKSPFSGKYTTIGAINLELKQAKLAMDSIPNNNLSKTLAQNTLVTTIEESGKALLKHNNELGHILVASAKKFNAASQMSDLFEFVNYAFKNNKEKAGDKLADISGGLAGAYVGAKIGARGGALGSAALSVIFGAMGSDKEKREWIINKLIHKNEHFNFRKGEFDNLEKYATQSEKIKQEMSSFKTTKESVIDTNNNHLFDLYHPNIIQDGTK
ncbi:hypothetical protein A4G16_01375 [Mannheimia granulomatis]|uniref:Uncharacterized protein n=1 Tax=Mannheimia granulomatis TaxID=85402 RepID=A0A6G8JFY4_9PAST|nr:hypothetical protein [Mannheimia granulomatis]QIM66122.1 hypothetical protein A4G16_01375 [Mannheimia granulomatis]